MTVRPALTTEAQIPEKLHRESMLKLPAEIQLECWEYSSGSLMGEFQQLKAEPADLGGRKLTRKPIAVINYFSRAGDDNLAAVFLAQRADPRAPPRHDHLDRPFRFILNHRSHRRRARTAARRFCLANAALPDAQLDSLTIDNAHEDDIRPVRKLFVSFNGTPNFAPVERLEIVDKQTTVWVSHLQRRNPKRSVREIELIVDNFFERRFRDHWDRCIVKLRLAQVGVKNIATGAGLLAQGVELDSGACAQTQLFGRPDVFVVKIRGGTTGSVPRKRGFTPVRLENSDVKIGVA